MATRKTLEQKIESKKAEVRKLEKDKRERDRKADAHNKIVLGALVIASGAEQLEPDVLVGGLVHLVSSLESRPENLEQFARLGAKRLEERKGR